jgi:diguanylate cyclase (GGDEF)-like protein/PAS domain S-box-containing protein
MTTEEDIAIAEVSEESAKLLSFLYACPVGLLEISLDGTINLINPLGMQLLLRLEPIPSMNFFATMMAYAPELRNLVESYAPSQGTICEGHRIFVCAGQAKEANLVIYSCTVIKLGVERYMVSLSDISEEIRQAQKLMEAESWFASLLDGANEFGLLSLDAFGKIVAINEAVQKLVGFSKEDLVGETVDFLQWEVAPDAGLSPAAQLGLADREGWHLHEDWQRHQNGSKLWCQRLIAVRHDQQQGDDGDGEVSGYTVVLREGQQRAIDFNDLKQRLTRDHLTGTFNRMHFYEVADRECARKKRSLQPLSLIMADIDFFKQVNDRFGHVAGDNLLKEFARRCMSLLRPSDTMARIGGEEFAVLLPATDADGAASLAERLRAIIGDTPIVSGEISLKITASFGCAELGKDCSVSTMLADADAVLYEAKRSGRDRVVMKRKSA